MKAFILSENDFKLLLSELELSKLKEVGFFRNSSLSKEALDEAHRVFHYVVTGWIQGVQR